MAIVRTRCLMNRPPPPWLTKAQPPLATPADPLALAGMSSASGQTHEPHVDKASPPPPNNDFSANPRAISALAPAESASILSAPDTPAADAAGAPPPPPWWQPVWAAAAQVRPLLVRSIKGLDTHLHVLEERITQAEAMRRLLRQRQQTSAHEADLEALGEAIRRNTGDLLAVYREHKTKVMGGGIYRRTTRLRPHERLSDNG